jgi:osmotically-inducible protein OsmY
MTMTHPVLHKALAALHSEPRIGPHFKPAALEYDGIGTLTIEGEVESVAAKKLALEHLAALPEVTEIVDRLRVKPAAAMGDGEIRARLTQAFYEDPAFQGLGLREYRAKRYEVVREPAEPVRGTIDIEVADGVVTLNGSVPGLASKRLAGVLAWWVAGTRDVINGLAVEPPEEDAPIRIEEAVRVAIEKNPFIDAGQIRVGVRHRVVRLTGLVHTEEQRLMAENDAWSVFGVDKVVNEIEVRPRAG